MNDVGFAVYGAFGGWNSGDEAILETVDRLLRPEGSDRPLTVICSKVHPSAVEHYRRCNRQFTTFRDVRQTLGVLRRHRLVIGGGQLITGDRSYKGLAYLTGLASAARRLHAPPLMIGIGAVGVHRFGAKRIVRHLVRQCEAVHCRDDHTLQMLQAAGADPAKLIAGADVVLSGVLHDRPMSDSPPLESDPRPSIAVGVHDAPNRLFVSPKQTRQMINSIARARPDHRIDVVSNDRREPFDQGFVRKVGEEVESGDLPDNVNAISYQSTAETIAAYFRAATTLSVRMHPLILSLVHGTPAVGIGPSQKVRDLGQRVGFLTVDIDDVLEPQRVDQTLARVKDQTANLDDVRSLARNSVASVIETAQ